MSFVFRLMIAVTRVREALIIRPAKLTKKARVRASTKKMVAVHDETLRKLAK